MSNILAKSYSCGRGEPKSEFFSGFLSEMSEQIPNILDRSSLLLKEKGFCFVKTSHPVYLSEQSSIYDLAF